MPRIFGFDIGTTSIGFAVIDHDPAAETGNILRLGVRIFPEARDPDGTPLNQLRRQKRMARRQLRRRKVRRRALNECFTELGLLPAFGSDLWRNVMAMDPIPLRVKGLREPLDAYELGRALYHLAKRRHFKGRDIADAEEEETSDEKEAKTNRETTLQELKRSGDTLGEFLARKPPRTRQRGIHAERSVVLNEFDRLVSAQADYHPGVGGPAFRDRVEELIFAQRPVFWRLNTLGKCRFMPDAKLCPKASWLSQQRRMLEKLNNLSIAGGNARPLDDEERAAILQQLQIQGSMTWPSVRSALKPLYKKREEPGSEKSLRFNLELGGDPKLLGNPIEAKFADIFGDGWISHALRQEIRDTVPNRLWAADYGEVGDQRVVILSDAERQKRRSQCRQDFVADFRISEAEAERLAAMSLPNGWEPYSTDALRLFMPHLEHGTRFGALVNGPEWEIWRRKTFPKHTQPTGEILDRLPSPANEEEQARLGALRNPTVIRVQNELRKVVNNLIGLYGKPDKIRVELARNVGKSKREREEIQLGQKAQEKRRKAAKDDLLSNGIDASRDDVEKWLLWKESHERCPYTGDKICFDALFRTGEYEVEHIWPRSRSLDDSFANKTLCRRDVNAAKGSKTPYEHFQHRPDDWSEIVDRLNRLIRAKGEAGMSPAKIRRFLADKIPEDFKSRQLNDTGFAARQAVAFLKRLWPDVGIEAPVNVEAVTGRVTAQLRHLWGLNHILADDGEKTRADHRHHAVDALVVACTHPGMTQRLSGFWQAKDDPAAPRPHLPAPWPTIRDDAGRSVAEIVVSHRVRKKLSGPLHKETIYGDTETNVLNKKTVYREFVTKKKVEALTKGELARIRDPAVRDAVTKWVEAHGGDPKKAFTSYPRLGPNGEEIRKVRITSLQQISLMAPLPKSHGYADLGSNHHIAIYRHADGNVAFEIISLFEASNRLAKREPIIKRVRDDGAVFTMSLSPGDALDFPSGPKSGIRIVQGVWASGQVVTVDQTDATGSSVWRPMASSIVAEGAKKISIDPIGRIRPAND